MFFLYSSTQFYVRVPQLKRENNSIASKANRIKRKEGSSYALISKDKEILAAEENLKWEKGAYSDLAKRLKYNGRYQL